MEKENETKFFTVKHEGVDNPLTITLPVNETSGTGKTIELELGAFFWNSPWVIIDEINPLPIIYIKIEPNAKTGNYDATGKSLPYISAIAPTNQIVNDNVQGFGGTIDTTPWTSYTYKFSPGRPDLQYIPPSPTITITFCDKLGNIIPFTQNEIDYNYYLSLNIEY